MMETDASARDAELDEMNRKCLLAMGWECFEGHAWLTPDSEADPQEWWLYHRDNPQAGENDLPPDLCRDPMAIGHMIRWLATQKQPGQYFEERGVYEPLDWTITCIHSQGESTYEARTVWDYVNCGRGRDWHYWGEGDTPGEALCRAIVAMTEGEKNG